MKKLAVLGFWFAVVCLGWTGGAGVAQTITGSVRGLVTDPSGAVVVGASIDAANVATGVTTHTTSDRAGLYNIQFLTIGSYTVTARASGFSTTTAGPFVLEIDQIAKVDLKLQVGRAKHFGSSWNRMTEEVLGGWKLAGNGLYSSGFPITIYQNPGNDNLNGAADQNYNYNGYGRVNQYFRPKLVHRSLSNWFGTDPSAVPCTTAGATINELGVPCAYGKPAFNQFGNAQNNTERGPNSKIIDLSLFKAFQTFREQTIKFRVDAFNAFNIVNYGLPASRVGKSTFGLINATSTGTYAPRQFQLSAVYQF